MNTRLFYPSKTSNSTTMVNEPQLNGKMLKFLYLFCGFGRFNRHGVSVVRLSENQGQDNKLTLLNINLLSSYSTSVIKINVKYWAFLQQEQQSLLQEEERQQKKEVQFNFFLSASRWD